MIKKIFKTSLLNLLMSILGLLLMFIMIAFITNMVGASEYGKYKQILAFIRLFVFLNLLGLDVGLLKFTREAIIEKNETDIYNIEMGTKLIVIIFNIFLLILLYVFKDFIIIKVFNSKISVKDYLISFPIIFFNAYYLLYSSLLRSYSKIREDVFIRSILLRVFKIIIFFIFIKFNFKSDGLIYGTFISFILLIIVSKYTLNLKIKRKSIGKFNYKVLKKMLHYSSPLMFNSFIILIASRLDILMIGYFLNTEKVAIYEISFVISNLVLFPFMAFSNVIELKIVDYFKKNKINELKQLYFDIVRGVTYLSLMIFFILLYLGKDILLIFGPSFISGYTTLIILAIGQLINTSLGFVYEINRMTGYPKYNLYSSIIVLLINTIFNFIFIPKFGVIGAALTTSTSLILGNIYNYYFVKKIHNITPFNKKTLKLLVFILLNLSMLYVYTKNFEVNNAILFILLKCSLFGIYFIMLIFILEKDLRKIIIRRK
ncbi:oligosaccharide flippase family protein [Fusobacteria bacterium ZRK30]|nr:oligosaccharide flippase family protein [Fusobacteria bacterium ZRK30]